MGNGNEMQEDREQEYHAEAREGSKQTSPEA